MRRRFWNRKKFVVVVASVATVILLAGLIVGFSAPKNELLTEMPTQRSRLQFLGPLRQPVSAAWQRFRAAWIKPPQFVPFSSYRLDVSVSLPSDLGPPLLTNSLGVCVWIVEGDSIQDILRKPGLVKYRWQSFPASELPPPPPTRYGGPYDERFEIQEHSFGGLTLNFVGRIHQTVFIGAAPGTTVPPMDHPSLRPFGAHVLVPKGSAVLILGPVTEFNPTLRYFGLFVPE